MQQFEIEKDQENLWDNIRQYRKNLKPNKSPNYCSNVPSDQKISQHKIIDANSQYSDSNKENMWSAVNAGTEQKFANNNNEEEQEQGFASISKGTQPFHNPLTQEYEVDETHGFILDSAKAAYSSRLVKSTRNSSFFEKGELDGENSFEGTDFAKSIQGDQLLVQQLMEQKRKTEEDLKGAKQLIIKTRKENNQNLKRVQADFKKEKEEIHKHYQQIINDMKVQHEKELKEKDEEIDALSVLISTNDENKKGNEDKNKLIEEYEEIIQSMKSEFEGEIKKMTNYNQKKTQQSREEKEKLEEEIQDLKNQILQLQCPPTKREYGCESSRLELETTNRMHLAENIPSIRIQNKPKQGKEINSLLTKISQYMDENTIENEVSITNRRDLYKEIYNAQNSKAKQFDIKPLNLAALKQSEKSKNKNQHFEELEGTMDNNLDSEYFLSIMEECQRNQETCEVFSEDEQEDTPKMNYTIKNLHNQLKFKPKYEDEE